MKKLLLLPLVLCLSGCSWFQRDQKSETLAHRDETTTKTTHTVGTQGGQPVDVTTTETTSTQRDDTSQTKGQSTISSPALDQVATSLGKLTAMLADKYAPGAGGIIQKLLGGVGLNEDTAALLASLGAAGAGIHLHKRGKKKGHEEAKKQAAQPPKLG